MFGQQIKNNQDMAMEKKKFCHTFGKTDKIFYSHFGYLKTDYWMKRTQPSFKLKSVVMFKKKNAKIPPHSQVTNVWKIYLILIMLRKFLALPLPLPLKVLPHFWQDTVSLKIITHSLAYTVTYSQPYIVSYSEAYSVSYSQLYTISHWLTESMFQCSNISVFQCSNVPIFQCSNASH